MERNVSRINCTPNMELAMVRMHVDGKRGPANWTTHSRKILRSASRNKALTNGIDRCVAFSRVHWFDAFQGVFVIVHVDRQTWS